MGYLPGYFKHIADKTFIDKYPKTIIRIDELIKGTLLEFGPGTGNDLVWLLQHGMLPDRLCSLESDGEAYKIVSDTIYRQLEKMFQDGMPLDRLFSMRNEEVASQIRSYTAQELALFLVFLHVPIGIQDPSYPPTESFNYVYANNLLHCLGSREGVNATLIRAYSHLKMGGVFFGRTLSDEIDLERLATILAKQNEIPEYTLVEQPPVRSFEIFWGIIESNGKVLSGRYICDADSPEGQLILERMNPERIRKIPNAEYEKLKFAFETARAVQEGILVGLPPRELEDMARRVGFAHVYTEFREHPWKPTKDFYFRFERQNR